MIINKVFFKIIIVIYLFIIIGLALYFFSNPSILTNYISDDAFYYFNTARNLGLGYGLSFDRCTKTNGFHPLYMLVCVPVFTMFSNYLYFPILLICILNLLFHLFSAILFFRLLKNFVANINTQLFLFSIYLFNPILLTLSLSGLEFSLNCFMFMLHLFLVIKPKKNYKIIGIVSSLLFLTRTDNAIYLIFMWAYIIFKPKNFKKILKTMFPFFIISLLWFIFSYIQTGDFMQISGLAKRLHNKHYIINFFKLSFYCHILNTLYDNIINWFFDFYAIKIKYTTFIIAILFPSYSYTSHSSSAIFLFSSDSES